METSNVTLRRLKTFLKFLENKFALKNHTHATSDITGLDTALSSKATLAQGKKADSAVQSVKIGTTEYKSGTTVTLPSYPTSLPANGGTSDYAKKLQIYKKDSTTETYGNQFPLYAQLGDNNHLKLKCDNYTVETDYADKAGSVAWSGITGKPDLTTKPYSVGTTAPTNTSMLWVDTSKTSPIMKYYNTTSKKWVPLAAVWS